MRMKLFENWGVDVKEDATTHEDIENLLSEYFQSVDQGYGYATLEKVIDDIDYEYDIKLEEDDILKFVNSHPELVNKYVLDGVTVICTLHAPSFDEIARDLGLDESMKCESFEEEEAEKRSVKDYGPELEEYFDSIYKGAGWVTLDKALEDLDFVYDVQTNEAGLLDWVRRHSELVNFYIIKNIPLILTKSAPSFRNILMDLGY